MGKVVGMFSPKYQAGDLVKIESGVVKFSARINRILVKTTGGGVDISDAEKLSLVDVIEPHQYTYDVGAQRQTDKIEWWNDDDWWREDEVKELLHRP